jgi:hypothetical protein
MGDHVEPEPRMLAAADTPVEQIDLGGDVGEQRIERLIQDFETRQFGVAQLHHDAGAFGGFDPRLPDSLLEDMDRTARDPRFDFRMPDLDAAARLLERPPALVYEPTRFDEYWEPNEDLLSEVLRKAVEKTTKEVRIPIPGARGRFLVCRVSLLAAGGACGVERNGGNDVVSLDDPQTLSATEAAACQAWWNRIVGASTQAEWRATQKLYEAECRKPLEKVPPQARPAPSPP